MRLRHLLLASALTLVPATSPALGQPIAQAAPRDKAIAEHREARDRWRTEQLPRVSDTCGQRARYEGETLVLAIGGASRVLTDWIDIYGERGEALGDPSVHILERCDDDLGLFVIRIAHWDWGETLLVPLHGTGPEPKLLGTPISAPNHRAVVVAERELGLWAGPQPGIEIAIRNSDDRWHKIWHHVPADAAEWSFLRWEGARQFRVMMWDGIKNQDGVLFRPHAMRWESVIEFSEHSFTRTDGPKTPDIPPTPRP